MNKALLIVDVQNDFTEGGALAIDGGDQIAGAISAFLNDQTERYSLVLASQDWHSPEGDNGGHFSETPDYEATWPAHCVMGTKGAEIDPLLSLPSRTIYLTKGQEAPAYSAFQGRTVDDKVLDTILAFHEVWEVDVVGLALDYCVKATALDAVRTGLKTAVIYDLTRAVDPELNGRVFDDLIREGVAIIGEDYYV